MRDWSGALVSCQQHLRKAESDLVLINAGLSPHIREALCVKAQEQLQQAMLDLLDAVGWVRQQ